METIIQPTIPEKLLTKDTRVLYRYTGSFLIGGPIADCGLGRKIIAVPTVVWRVMEEGVSGKIIKS